MTFGAPPAHSNNGSERCLVFGLCLWLVGACGPEPEHTAAESNPSQGATVVQQAPVTQETQPWFKDVAAEANFNFVHDNGHSEAFPDPEFATGGCALFDMDLDGDLDIFVVQSGVLKPSGSQGGPTGRLFRNLLERGSLQFEDITAEAGFNQSKGYGMGAAVGDVNGDGLPDLYVTRFGPNSLYRNLGNGKFEEVTTVSGSQDERWSVSAGFVDYDRDGDLDLYVGNYTNFSLKHSSPCYSPTLDYCAPSAHEPLPDKLLRNRGDGTFEDITQASGLKGGWGAALGVVADDFDRDGYLDLYVANDMSANLLWRNKGDGTFEDVAMLSGSALNGWGVAEASMGIEAIDFDMDGHTDLFLTHLLWETNTLYLSDGHGGFSDQTNLSGLGYPSKPVTGFGTVAVDVDSDGLLDLFVANGAVLKRDHLMKAGDPYPYAEVNQFFMAQAPARFIDASQQAGVDQVAISRGVARGDVDNDGDSDILVVNLQKPSQLLLNQMVHDNAWVGLVPKSASGGLVHHAEIELALGDGLVRRRVRVDGSYASGQDGRILVGLGSDASPREVLVRWPDGTSETFGPLATGQYHHLLKGSGK